MSGSSSQRIVNAAVATGCLVLSASADAFSLAHTRTQSVNPRLPTTESLADSTIGENLSPGLRLASARVEAAGSSSFPDDSATTTSSSTSHTLVPGQVDTNTCTCDTISTMATTPQLARKILESNEEVDWFINASAQSFLDVATKSFAGSEATAPEPGVEWTLRGVVPTEFNQDRRDLYRYALESFLTEPLKKGAFFFGHRTSSMENKAKLQLGKERFTDDDTDAHIAMASAATLLEYDPQVERAKKKSGILDDLMAVGEVVLDIIAGRLPAPLKSFRNLKAIFTRGNAIEEEMQELHIKYGPQENHLFVYLVAVDPSYQGRGFGKQLMNQICVVSDTVGLSCYLECTGERNLYFYRKFGFRIVHEQTFIAEEDASNQIVIYCMVRDPKK